MARVYWIYAIRLSDEVLTRRRFLARNPDYKPGKPCYYVGSSVYPPKKRFEMHKSGHKSSWWVREFGQHVATKKCFRIEVENAEERDGSERAYAEELRAVGYGIWQN